MRFLILLVMVIPGFAMAAGGGSTTPAPTETSKNCKGVKVWDKKTQTCVDPQESSLDQDEMMQAVRSLAYAGRNQDAQGLLRQMHNQDDDLVLTYWGFTSRKLGQIDQANVFYSRAIAQNPDNFLARSYMAQGFVSAGRIDEAIAQWREIKERGGEGTWAEASLRKAIRTGLTYNY